MKIQRSFISFLDSNGIQYTKTDSLVSFNQEDVNFIFLCDAQDPNFFRMVIPNIDIGTDMSQINEKLDRLTKNYKVGKAELLGGKVWLVFEQFVADLSADNTSLFIRSVKILTSMFNELRTMIYGGDSSINTENSSSET